MAHLCVPNAQQENTPRFNLLHVMIVQLENIPMKVLLCALHAWLVRMLVELALILAIPALLVSIPALERLSAHLALLATAHLRARHALHAL
jgi:hypothetical protein